MCIYEDGCVPWHLAQCLNKKNQSRHSSSHQEEGQPGLDKGPETDIFTVDHHEETQLDHVPLGRAIIMHEVQCHSDMGVAVVAEQVVHSALVLL